MHTFQLRVASLAMVISGVCWPGGPIAAADSAPGTLVGTITCGADEATPAHAVVAIEGMQVQTTTSGTGRFVLTGVPSGQPLTIDAIADPQASDVSSRFNVTVQPGQTLDVGSIDLAVCGQWPPAVVEEPDQAEAVGLNNQ